MEQQKENIEVNENAIEPNEYFKVLKGSRKKQTNDKLQAQLRALGEHIIAAKSVGQKSFLEKLSYGYSAIIKEQQILAHGYDTFVYTDDVKKLIENVKPKNSVRIIELDRYPRSIPLHCLKKIKEAKDLNLFDEYVVVFTDLSGKSSEDYQTGTEKEFVKRNKDPIVFGMFRHETTQLTHERLYFICDWEDELCNLTFSKLIEALSKDHDISNPERKIGYDEKYLNEIVHDVMGSLDNRNLSIEDIRNKKETPLFTRIIQKLWKK